MFNILKQKLTRDDTEPTQSVPEAAAPAPEPVEAQPEQPASDAASLFCSIAFIDLEAQDLLTPADRLTAVQADDPPVMVSKAFRESGFSRLPVFAGERISGVVREKDFHYQVLGGGKTLADVTLEPLRVAPGCKLSQLLPQLHSAPARLAVVEDENGPRGLVTLDDALRAVFGKEA